MSIWQFIRESLRYYRRINGAVALGVAACTAVLTGALLIGDSVRGSLRGLTLDRLGRIEAALLAPRYVDEQLAARLEQADGFSPHFHAAVPAIMFARGTIERPGQGQTQRASQVLVVGSDASFWDMGTSPVRPQPMPGAGEIVLNEPLAGDLGANLGDDVTLRLPEAGAVPAESPLGKKEDRIRGIPRLNVVAIVPAEGLGRFDLRARQRTPRNAFVALETLRGPLGREGKINTLFVSGGSGRAPLDAADCETLDQLLQPSLEDYGLSVQRVRLGYRERPDEEEHVVLDYYDVTTDRMLMDRATEQTVTTAVAGDQGQPVFTYLANALIRVPEESGAGWEPGPESGIPYSTVSAVDSQPEIGPLLDADGRPIALRDNEIALNQWAATDLKAAPGDTIRIVYFRPETTHGEPVETHADFTLRAVIPLTEPAQPFRRDGPADFDQRPTAANDYHLTPEVAGITDQESIDRWEIPFTLTRPIRPKDDDYYGNHRLTPKAFVSLAAGQRLWGSRFGAVTSVRIRVPKDLPPAQVPAYGEQLKHRLREQIRQSKDHLGLSFAPIKEQGLAASRGTTPFDVLFLALSFFIIAAALMLVALLFRLGIEQRAEEVGVLLASGLRRKTAGRLLVAEGALVAALGALLGIVAGAGYAWLMIRGLRSGWWGKFTTPFLQFHCHPRSLVLGYAMGVLVSVLTIGWSIRQLRHVSVRRLLSGRAREPMHVVGHQSRRWTWASVGAMGLATVLLVAATRLGGESQAGAFVGGGALMLAALLILVWSRLRGERAAALAGPAPLLRLASSSAGRNPMRSTMTIGLMALASFLIVALSSFRLEPTAAGVGGFDLIAESSEPVFADLGKPAVRDQLLGQQASILEGSVVLALRAKSGDDASCNSLYKAARPRVLGVTPAMIEYFDHPDRQGFSWADSSAESDEDRTNPWRLLNQPSPDGRVPVVIDKNTAMYGLGLYGGIGQEVDYEYEPGITVGFRVVGLLSNSVLQGNLLIGEEQFERHFPEVAGYRYFLVRTPPEQQDAVAKVFEDRLGDQGFDVASAVRLLGDLLAVQNTYLGTFQSLGALGLLLGTFGLATVQLRNVLERRAELALLRAAGFRRRRLAYMVLLENLALLFCGLGVGVFAALWSVLPHMVFGAASVPVGSLAVLLGAVLLAGVVASFAAVVATLRAPLVSALRGD